MERVRRLDWTRLDYTSICVRRAWWCCAVLYSLFAGMWRERWLDECGWYMGRRGLGVVGCELAGLDSPMAVQVLDAAAVQVCR